MPDRNDPVFLGGGPEVLPDRPGERFHFLKGRIDRPFLLMTLLLLAVGLVLLYSASYAIAYYNTVGSEGGPNPMRYLKRQALFAVLGVGAMFFASVVPLRFLRRFSIPAIIVAFILLLGVLVTGLRGGGAVRWIGLTENQGFQPSELVKAAVILAFSDWAARFGPQMKDFRHGVLPFAMVLIVFGALLLMQPHLSATIIILAVGAMIMFAGGTRLPWFIAAAAVGIMAILYIRSHGDWVIAKALETDNYMLRRVAAWLSPEALRQKDGWQILQSLYAVGSGGLLGLGLGNSRQKYLYLPEAQNDYIFSIICEELGFVGAVLILMLFAVLILRGFWLALQCRDPFHRLMIVGFTGHIFIQVFLNVAVVTNLIPSTGISLPFFSYGGTALIVQLAEVGIILSASREIGYK